MSNQHDLLRFREIVIDDVKGSSTEEFSNYLHENLDLWLYVLQTLRREVELQISCQNSKFKMDMASLSVQEQDIDMASTEDVASKILDLKIRHNKWRMSVLKFLTNIETKSLYVKMTISRQSNNYLKQGE
jgi:thermostable 8-oxoguanine DNA glycosylase